jgi:glycosyltransferase involved in cell wall biosynthesis
VTFPTASTARLAVVLSHPTQYYSPWFRWLSTHTQLRLRVFYLWDFGITRRHDPNFGRSFEWDVDLLSGYDSEVVPNKSRRPGAENFFGFRNPQLTRRIAEWKPDALLLFGYKWESHMRVIAWAVSHRVPLIFRGDSHLLGRGLPAFHVRFALRVLFSRFDSFLYVGAANREYFEAFGVPARKLFFAPHSVNTQLFSPKAPGHQEAAEGMRGRLGIPRGTRIVLFAGKLVSAKQPAELLEAFVTLNPRQAALVFVGDGPEGEKLKAMASERARSRGDAQVHFLPFANQSEMPSRYLLADLFVLPSRGIYETWGLAVNEAMHMGVPCLVSNLVGCQRDLVTHGETGWVFDPSLPGSLGSALSEALSALESPSSKAEFRKAVEARISGYTYTQTTEGLIAALGALKG